MNAYSSRHVVSAPKLPAGDVDAALDFLSQEIYLAGIYADESVEVLAEQDLLPTLAQAAAAFESADLPTDFHFTQVAHI